MSIHRSVCPWQTFGCTKKEIYKMNKVRLRQLLFEPMWICQLIPNKIEVKHWMKENFAIWINWKIKKCFLLCEKCELWVGFVGVAVATEWCGNVPIRLWYERSRRHGNINSAAVGTISTVAFSGLARVEQCCTKRAFDASNPGKLAMCAISELLVLLLAWSESAIRFIDKRKYLFFCFKITNWRRHNTKREQKIEKEKKKERKQRTRMIQVCIVGTQAKVCAVTMGFYVFGIKKIRVRKVHHRMLDITLCTVEWFEEEMIWLVSSMNKRGGR